MSQVINPFDQLNQQGGTPTEFGTPNPNADKGVIASNSTTSIEMIAGIAENIPVFQPRINKQGVEKVYKEVMSDYVNGTGGAVITQASNNNVPFENVVVNFYKADGVTLKRSTTVLNMFKDKDGKSKTVTKTALKGLEATIYGKESDSNPIANWYKRPESWRLKTAGFKKPKYYLVQVTLGNDNTTKLNIAKLQQILNDPTYNRHIFETVQGSINTIAENSKITLLTSIVGLTALYISLNVETIKVRGYNASGIHAPVADCVITKASSSTNDGSTKFKPHYMYGNSSTTYFPTELSANGVKFAIIAGWKIANKNYFNYIGVQDKDIKSVDTSSIDLKNLPDYNTVQLDGLNIFNNMPANDQAFIADVLAPFYTVADLSIELIDKEEIKKLKKKPISTATDPTVSRIFNILQINAGELEHALQNACNTNGGNKGRKSTGKRMGMAEFLSENRVSKEDLSNYESKMNAIKNQASQRIADMKNKGNTPQPQPQPVTPQPQPVTPQPTGDITTLPQPQ